MCDLHTLRCCIALQDVSDRALSGANVTPEADLTREMACAQGQAKCADTEQAVLQAADAKGSPKVAAADEDKPLLTQPSKQAFKCSTGTATVAEGAKSEVPKDNCGRADNLQQVSTPAPCCLSQHATRDRHCFALIWNLPVNLYVTAVAPTSLFHTKQLLLLAMHSGKPCCQHLHAQHCVVNVSVCAMPHQRISPDLHDRFELPHLVARHVQL